MRQVTVQLPDELYDELESDRGEASRSDWVRDAVRMKMRDKPTFQVDSLGEMMAMMLMEENQTEIGDILENLNGMLDGMEVGNPDFSDASTPEEVEGKMMAMAASKGMEKAESDGDVERILGAISGESEAEHELPGQDEDEEEEEPVQLSREEYERLKELIGGDEDE